MSDDADFLLAGPRGRRLCLELAEELDPAVRSAVFDLGYELDPGKGTSRVLFGLMVPSDSGSGGDDGSCSGPVSPEELAAVLASMTPPGVDDGLVWRAFETAVNSARYWQPPEGEDVLAALPVIREALVPLAALVMETRAMSPGAQPRLPRQWAVDWQNPDAPPPLEQDPRRRLADWGRGMRAEERRAAEAAYGLDANVSGSWWSIPTGLLRSVGRIPAGLNLVEDALGWQKATAIPLLGAGRTLEINTETDWKALCRRFPLEVTASRRHDWFQTTGRDGRWVIPDWEQVAGEWDAVHLTVRGYLGNAGRALMIDDTTASVIAGWDPDETIWLTDAVRETGGPRQEWHRSAQDGNWTLHT